MCNAHNHPPGCRCGWGGEGHLGGGAGRWWGPGELPPQQAAYFNPDPENFCRRTQCPKPDCRRWVYFIRHNGGSVWVNELGIPWPKHECFDGNNRPDSRHFLGMLNAVMAGMKKPELGIVTSVSYPPMSSRLHIVVKWRSGRKPWKMILKPFESTTPTVAESMGPHFDHRKFDIPPVLIRTNPRFAGWESMLKQFVVFDHGTRIVRFPFVDKVRDPSGRTDLLVKRTIIELFLDVTHDAGEPVAAPRQPARKKKARPAQPKKKQRQRRPSDTARSSGASAGENPPAEPIGKQPFKRPAWAKGVEPKRAQPAKASAKTKKSKKKNASGGASQGSKYPKSRGRNRD